MRPNYAHGGAGRLLLHRLDPLEQRRDGRVLCGIAARDVQEERVLRHEEPVRRPVHTVPRRIVDVDHQRRAPADAPAPHVDAHSAVARGAHGGAPERERVREAALTHRLVAEQHQLCEVAHCVALGEVAQELQDRARARRRDVRRRRVQRATAAKVESLHLCVRREPRRKRRQRPAV